MIAVVSRDNLVGVVWIPRNYTDERERYGQSSWLSSNFAACHAVSLGLIPVPEGVVDCWASSDAACQAGGLGSISGPSQTYV
jgi:hypothetical protein